MDQIPDYQQCLLAHLKEKADKYAKEHVGLPFIETRIKKIQEFIDKEVKCGGTN